MSDYVLLVLVEQFNLDLALHSENILASFACKICEYKNLDAKKIVAGNASSFGYLDDVGRNFMIFLGGACLVN